MCFFCFLVVLSPETTRQPSISVNVLFLCTLVNTASFCTVIESGYGQNVQIVAIPASGGNNCSMITDHLVETLSVRCHFISQTCINWKSTSGNQLNWRMAKPAREHVTIINGEI